MQANERIKIWDPLVRVFHWTLVAAFITAYVSEDEALNLHVMAGYTIAGLLAVRLLWGLVGSRYARFGNFIYSPSTIRAYLKDVVAFRARSYLGHNPAGGAMVLALLVMLLLTALTGMATYGAGEQAGPLAGLMSGMEGEWAEELHEFCANTTLALVVLHVLGVILASLQHRENLVAAMWHGYKHKDGGE